MNGAPPDYFIRIRFDAMFPPGSDPESTVMVRVGPPKPPIPRTLHYVWLSEHPEDVPAPFDYACREQAAAMHPGWAIADWTDNAILSHAALAHIRPLLDSAWEKMAGERNARSDLIRLAVLFVHGGIYLDYDVWPIRPFDEFLNGSEGLLLGANSFDPFVIGEHVIGSSPLNPRMLAILKYFAEAPKNPVAGGYSPHLARFAYHHNFEFAMPDVFCPGKRGTKGEDRYRVGKVTHALHCWSGDEPYDLDRLKALAQDPDWAPAALAQI